MKTYKVPLSYAIGLLAFVALGAGASVVYSWTQYDEAQFELNLVESEISELLNEG